MARAGYDFQSLTLENRDRKEAEAMSLSFKAGIRNARKSGCYQFEMPTSYRHYNNKATFHRNYANRKCFPIMPLLCLAKPDCDGNCRSTWE